MKEFIKWFLDSHMAPTNIAVWRELFMNFITWMFVATYCYLEAFGHKDPQSMFNLRMILVIVLNYYFTRGKK